MAHDYADGASFYGFNLSQYLPFNIARTWHLQLAIFWIATAWLGMGIFIAPLVSGKRAEGSARAGQHSVRRAGGGGRRQPDRRVPLDQGHARATRGGGSARRAGSTWNSAGCGCCC